MEKKTAISSPGAAGWVGWVVLVAGVLHALALGAKAEVSPASRDLLATEDGGRIWVSAAQQGTGEMARYTLTNIQSRVRFGQWADSPQILGRVVSMAGSDGELLVVLQNGQLQIVDDTDVRSGIPLPGDGLLCVANGQQSVWAIVQGVQKLTTMPDVDAAARDSDDAATEPSGSVMVDVASAATMPSTEPTTQSAPPPLFAWRLSAGKWVDGVTIPADVSEDPQQLSMTVVNGLPIIAWRASDKSVRVIRLNKDNTWSAGDDIPVAVAEDFKLLSIDGSPAMWLGTLVSGGAATLPGGGQPGAGRWSAGEMLTGEHFTDLEDLGVPGVRPANIQAQTFNPALDRLRWFGVDGSGRIAEQTFDVKGKAVATAPLMARAPEPTPIGPWAGASALMVVISAAAATRTRQVPLVDAESGAAKAAPKPELAPLRARIAAGLVDLIPLIAVAAIFRPVNGTNWLGDIDATSLVPFIELAVLTYLLHVTIAEMICGQSVGKMVFGLRVMTAQGGEPNWMSILIRNGLRVVDVALMGLPLILVATTPLHQRVGDLVAGTVVVSLENGDQSG